jgi:hypothetical protein
MRNPLEEEEEGHQVARGSTTRLPVNRCRGETPSPSPSRRSKRIQRLEEALPVIGTVLVVACSALPCTKDPPG